MAFRVFSAVHHNSTAEGRGGPRNVSPVRDRDAGDTSVAFRVFSAVHRNSTAEGRGGPRNVSPVRDRDAADTSVACRVFSAVHHNSTAEGHGRPRNVSPVRDRDAAQPSVAFRVFSAVHQVLAGGKSVVLGGCDAGITARPIPINLGSGRAASGGGSGAVRCPGCISQLCSAASADRRANSERRTVVPRTECDRCQRSRRRSTNISHR